jgi:hypothetical protein
MCNVQMKKEPDNTQQGDGLLGPGKPVIVTIDLTVF